MLPARKWPLNAVTDNNNNKFYGGGFLAQTQYIFTTKWLFLILLIKFGPMVIKINTNNLVIGNLIYRYIQYIYVFCT